MSGESGRPRAGRARPARPTRSGMPAGDTPEAPEEAPYEVRLEVFEGPLDLLLYLPNERTGPVPVFMGLNFSGNHAIHPDPAIPLARFAGFRRERQRGSQARRWAVDHIIDRGYGLATMHCADIDPDFDDGFAESPDDGFGAVDRGCGEGARQLQRQRHKW